ncbi:hypothetical protein [endosymbiont of Tevnia jerichonana]|jgi:hypothetical protein|uniref:hypothetical protein n=1 Tax=endosymbiont of Tevnia jerichonana TaxID=94785 RepID=UPI00059376EE|nr:hypothetical protein [endosymbiont of Tevnia jerichonana]
MRTLLLLALLSLSLQAHAFFCLAFKAAGNNRASIFERLHIPPPPLLPPPPQLVMPVWANSPAATTAPSEKIEPELINGYRFRPLPGNRTRRQAVIPLYNH